MQGKQLRPYRARPACPQPEHHQRAVSGCADNSHDATGQRQQSAFDQKQIANGCIRKAQGAEHADFPQPLLDAEPEEERRQQ